MASTTPAMRTRPHTIHLEASNHSLGYVTGLAYNHANPATTASTKSNSSEPASSPLLHYYGGIPYALPPLGPYRFKRPRPLPACYRYGTLSNPGSFTGKCGVCPQPGYMGPPNEKLWDEDCLQLNVWVPAESAEVKRPAKGWPIFFFIHGGWLQHGTPNSVNPSQLLAETGCKAIIVTPAYRLNVLGFLASEELNGLGREGVDANCGFWDQRLALEWTFRWISYFGGDPGQITVGGYSAGAHSTLHQLHHDLRQPPHKRIIKRAILFSNGPGLQPKPLHSPTTHQQHTALLRALNIPHHLPPHQKLAHLRSLPARSLIDAASSLDLHEFRATTDDAFVSPSLFTEIDNGNFAARLRDAGIELLTGECKDENFVYGSWRPPRNDTFDACRKRLCADYSPEVVDAALAHYCPGQSLPMFKGRRCKTWYEAFGQVYAELQVHALERGFLSKLEEFGAGRLVRRYRMEWRAEVVDKTLPREWGVTHGSDMAIWFWAGLKEGREKEVVRQWAEPFWRWVCGEGWVGWEAGSVREARRLRSDGEVDVWRDPDWEHGVKVWDIVREAHKHEAVRRETKL